MLVNILGCGAMGSQIAALLSLLRYDVQVWNRSSGLEVRQKIDRASRLMKRSMLPGEVEGKVSFVDSVRNLKPAMTIEALAEDLDVKRDIIAALPYDVAENELFTNTSSLDPGRVHHSAVGFHFFNPVYAVKVLEVSKKVDQLLPDSRDLVARLEMAGYEVVEVNSNPGYIGNFILFQEISAALKLVDNQGYGCNQIDKLTRALGRPASIFDVIDMIGIDVTKQILENFHANDTSFYVSPCLDRALVKGIMGRKNKTTIRSAISPE